MKPIFKNRPNKVHFVKDGDGDRDVWESRSTALGAVIFGIYQENIFVLVEKRSMNMPEGPGQWACPSGYIDYDEDGWEAIKREVYEETSFYLDDYERYLTFNNDEDSFYTHTKPGENRQNIVVWYCMIYDFSGTELPRDIEQYKDHEVDIVKWIPIEHVFNGKYDWAFAHDQRIEKAANKFENYLAE